MKKPWVLNYPLSAQRRLWSDWGDAQADLSLRWAHSHFVGFIMRRLICVMIFMFYLLGHKFHLWKWKIFVFSFCHKSSFVKFHTFLITEGPNLDCHFSFLIKHLENSNCFYEEVCLPTSLSQIVLDYVSMRYSTQSLHWACFGNGPSVLFVQPKLTSVWVIFWKWNICFHATKQMFQPQCMI